MTAQEFLQEYAPIKGYSFALNEYEAHGGTLPTIKETIEQYGTRVCLQAIDAAVVDFLNFVRDENAMTIEQRKQLAYVIASTYRHMKVAELLVFFVQAKAGKFGKFYQRIEPLDITTKLCEWWQICLDKRNRFAEMARDQFTWARREDKQLYNYDYSDAVIHFDKEGQAEFNFANTHNQKVKWEGKK